MKLAVDNLNSNPLWKFNYESAEFYSHEFSMLWLFPAIYFYSNVIHISISEIFN